MKALEKILWENAGLGGGATPMGGMNQTSGTPCIRMDCRYDDGGTPPPPPTCGGISAIALMGIPCGDYSK
jgi:hypothetical protein